MSPNKRHRISIAMASYNGEQHIEAQILSILGQTVVPCEIVISDDCSSDETVRLVNSLIKKQPSTGVEIKLLENDDNVGFGNNFIRAVEGCAGEVIFLADQDDIWLPHKVESVVSMIEKDNAYVYMNDAAFVDDTLKPFGVSKMGELARIKAPEERFTMGCCAAITRSYLEKFNFKDVGLMSHDFPLVWASNVLGRTSRIKECLQLYRLHASNTSSFSVNARLKPAEQTMWQRLRSKLEKHGVHKSLMTDVHEREALLRILGQSSFSDEEAAILSERLRSEIFVIESRIQNLERSPIGRILPCLLFYGRGGYRYFSGYKSLLMDLVRF